MIDAKVKIALKLAKTEAHRAEIRKRYGLTPQFVYVSRKMSDEDVLAAVVNQFHKELTVFLCDNGFSQTSVAKFFGVSRQAIQAKFKKALVK